MQTTTKALVPPFVTSSNSKLQLWAAVLFLAVALVGGWLFAIGLEEPLRPQLQPTSQLQLEAQLQLGSQSQPVDTATGTTSPPGATVETHHEVIPNPVHGSEFTVAPQCQASDQPCEWGDAATWLAGLVPQEGTRVIVDGHVQIANTDAIARSIGVYPGGTLSFARNVDTELVTADLVVFDGGTLHVGTSDAPINSDVQAEIIFRELPFDETDPTQILRGLVASGGTVRVSGNPLSNTYLPTLIEPTQGSTTITTAESMSSAGWSVGDSITIPGSQQCRPAAGDGCDSQTEDRTILSVSGGTAILDAPLSYDHPGARDVDGQITFTPHVINTTRNVVFRSENPNGVRAHALFHGRVDVDIRYAELVDMGRTTIDDLGPNNQKGRYPLHAHHLIGPHDPQANGYQFTLIGNKVDFGEENVTHGHKWGISIHGSHYGLIEGNTVDNASGAAIVTESGSEAGNMIRENFAVRVVGGNGERLADLDPFDNTKSGRAGVGFWFNGGGRNSVVDNVAADVTECTFCFGFKFDNVFPADATVLFPDAQGQDPLIEGGETVPAKFVGINDFVDNEAYAVPNGMTVWWVCATFETPHDNCSSNLDSFNVWHHHRWGFYGYETNNMTLENFVIRGDEAALSNQFELVRGLEFGDYLQRNLVVSNADIQNMEIGMRLPAFRDERGATGPDDGLFVLEDSYVVATEGLKLFAPHSVNGTPDDLSAQTALIRNVQFDYPGVAPAGVERNHIVVSNQSVLADNAKSNFERRNDVIVENYNRAPGVDGDDFTIVPGYQDPSRCQGAVSNCDINLTARYGDIENGHIFPVAGAPVPGIPAEQEPVEQKPVEEEPVGNDPIVAPGVPNLLINGGFGSELEPWTRWSLDYNVEVSVESGEVRMAHVDVSGHNFSQLSQRVGRVESGDTYRLRFDIRSNRSDGTIDVLFEQFDSPWGRLTNPAEVQVDQSVRTVELMLTSNATSAETKLMFQLQDEAQTVWIDNVELTQVQ